MDELLNGLNRVSYTGGALDLAKLVLLWKEHFDSHPSHEDIATLLLKMGSQQHFWKLTNNSIIDGK